jgi:tRNA(Ile)-lysidine synthase
MNRVQEAILRDWPIERWINSTVVVALSGGPDSVALVRALDSIVRQYDCASQVQLVLAHLNHRLRGIDSDRDEAFVRDLAAELKLQAIVESLGDSHRTGGEDSWRRARMSFLKGVAKRVHATWIATAATADDSVETMLHHLLRGSGPAGLAGIRFERKLAEGLVLVHPLIGVWKSQLLEYLDSLGQSFRIDSSNQTSDFMRNRIRNECLPFLERFIGSDQLRHRLRIASDLIRQEHEVIEHLAMEWLDSEFMRWGADHIEADFKEFSELPWPVLQCGLVRIWHRMGWPLQQIGFRHWDRVRRWVELAKSSNHPSRMQLPGPVELQIARRLVRIRALSDR